MLEQATLEMNSGDLPSATQTMRSLLVAEKSLPNGALTVVGKQKCLQLLQQMKLKAETQLRAGTVFLL